MAIVGYFAEFYVSDEAGASDFNGGGPRFSANGGPVDSTIFASVAAGGLEISHGIGWTDVQVDDWIVWDVGNVLANGQEWRRVTSIAGLPASFTVHAAVNGAAAGGPGITIYVGGHWATANHAAGNTVGTDCEVDATSLNSSGYPPRVNVKGYAPGVYDHSGILFNGSGSSGRIATYEGYETEAGDRCPNGIRPVLLDNANMLLELGIPEYYSIVLFDCYMTGDHDMVGCTNPNTSEFNTFTDCRFTKSGASTNKNWVTPDINSSFFMGCEFISTTPNIFYMEASQSNFFGCLVEGGLGSIPVIGGPGVIDLRDGSSFLFSIAVNRDGHNTTEIYVGDYSIVLNCIVYCDSVLGIHTDQEDSIVENTIVYCDQQFEFYFQVDGVPCRNCRAYDVGIVPFRWDRGYINCVVEDSRLYDITNNRYQLGPNSPCIDAVDPDTFLFMSDIASSVMKLDIGPLQLRRRTKAVSPVTN